MEKQYSVEFFTNFVDNLQSLCHSYIDFSQSVEVSGYVCVEIDNVKKERYVLSEMIQSIGRSISESYCTKVFKSTPTGPVQRFNVRDITNRSCPSSESDLRDGSMSQQSYSSSRQNVRPLNLKNQASSPSTSRPQRTSIEHLSQTTSSSSNHSFLSGTQLVHGHERINSGQTDSLGKSMLTSLRTTHSLDAPNTNSSVDTESNQCKRKFADTPNVKSESTNMTKDDNVIIIKEEHGGVEEDEECLQPPLVKRRVESFRLPDSLTADQAQNSSAEDDFQDPVSSCTYEIPSFFQSTAPDLDLFLTESSGHSLEGNPILNSSLNTSAVIHKIRPCPVMVKTPSGTRFTCQLCRNSTSTEMSFVMHMNAHPSCKSCGVFVGTHMDLRSHIQSEHGKMNMHKCKFCDKVFLTRSGVVEHQRLKHENTAPRFVCTVCGHVCVRKRHLEDHLENVHNKKNKCPS